MELKLLVYLLFAIHSFLFTINNWGRNFVYRADVHLDMELENSICLLALIKIL